MNPYTGETFFGVIITFFVRMFEFLIGQIGIDDLASDEIQILVLMLVSISAALVGCFLILRKMTMLANALSHTILIGIVAAFFLFTPETSDHGTSGGLNIQAMLFAAVLMGLVTSFLTQFLTRIVKLQEDASIGLVFTSLFALGIILVTALTRNTHIGIEVVMGNVDALLLRDLNLVAIILVVNVVILLLLFKEYKITTFDPGLAQSLGISTLFFDNLLMIQVSGTAVGAFRAVGVIMVLALITGPALTARLLTHHLKWMLLLACAIGCLASLFGVALSRHILSVNNIALTTGGLVVCVIILFYLLALLFSPQQGLVARLRHRSDLRSKLEIES